MLEERGARVLGAELAPREATVDRLAEHRGLPEGERLEPGERLDVPAGALAVALDQLVPRREAVPRAVTGEVPSGFSAPPGSV